MELQDQPNRNRSGLQIPISGIPRVTSMESEQFLSPRLLEDDGDFVRRGHSRMFADPEQMKLQLREKLFKAESRVEDLYRESGRCSKLARSRKFENVTTAVILLNAVWIGVDVQWNTQDLLIDAKPVFQVAENLFCTYFFAEVLTRFLAYRNKRDCLKDWWFVFDASLVALMVLEVWVLTIFFLVFPPSGDSPAAAFSDVITVAKFVRLARLFRMARLLRSFPELLILLKGMMAAMRSVIFTLALLFLLAYIFGIMFKSLAAGSDAGADYFSSVGLSIQTFVVQGTFLDNLADLIEALTTNAEANGSWYLLFFFYLYIFLSSLTVINMLIGVICEAVSTVAAVEREEIMLNTVKVKLKQVMNYHQQRGTSMHSNSVMSAGHMISKADFRAMLGDEEAARCLNDVGVDVLNLVDIADFIFEDPRHGGADRNEISFLEFVDVILRFRGTNWVTVKDLVETRRFVHGSIRSLEEKVLKSLRGDQPLQRFTSRSPSAVTSPDQSLRGDQSLHGRQDSEASFLQHELRSAWEPLPAPSGPAASAAGRRQSLPANFALPSSRQKDQPPLPEATKQQAAASTVAEVQEALSGLQRAFRSFLETAEQEHFQNVSPGRSSRIP